MAVGAFIVLVWVFYVCLLKLLFWLLYHSCPQCAFLPAAVVVLMLLFAMAGRQWCTAFTDCVTACSAACVVNISKVRCNEAHTNSHLHSYVNVIVSVFEYPLQCEYIIPCIVEMSEE